jgi:hypothetical protein
MLTMLNRVIPGGGPRKLSGKADIAGGAIPGFCTDPMNAWTGILARTALRLTFRRSFTKSLQMA